MKRGRECELPTGITPWLQNLKTERDREREKKPEEEWKEKEVVSKEDTLVSSCRCEGSHQTAEESLGCLWLVIR